MPRVLAARGPPARPDLFPPLLSCQCLPISCFPDGQSHHADRRGSPDSGPYVPGPGGYLRQTPALWDHRDAGTSARPRVVPEVPAGRGRGSWRSGGRGHSVSSCRGARQRRPRRPRVGAAQVRPRPARLRPRPGSGELPLPGPGEWPRVRRCDPSPPDHLSLRWPWVRVSPIAGKPVGAPRRRLGSVCGSVATLGPPARKP